MRDAILLFFAIMIALIYMDIDSIATSLKSIADDTRSVRDISR